MNKSQEETEKGHLFIFKIYFDIWLMLSQTWFKNRRFKWRKEIKKAEEGRPERVMAASPVLLLPSSPALPYQRPNLAPADHQDGSMYAGCCAVNPTMRFSSNTHW